MSKSQPKAKERDLVKHVTSRESQNKQAQQAAQQAGLGAEGTRELHDALNQAHRAGEKLTFPEIADLAKEVKETTGDK